MTSYNGLHVGLHIEHLSTRVLVVAMLESAGYEVESDAGKPHELAAYLEGILSRSTAVSENDLLILEEANDAWMTSPLTLALLLDLLTFSSVPILILTQAPYSQIKALVPHFSQVAFLPRAPLVLHVFLESLSLLRERSGHRGVHELPPTKEEQLACLERARCALRLRWLDQRQDWLDYRQAWLANRAGWIDRLLEEENPQTEWLAELRDWVASEQQDVEKERQKIEDLRGWVSRYLSRIDEEFPPSFREAQG